MSRLSLSAASFLFVLMGTACSAPPPEEVPAPPPAPKSASASGQRCFLNVTRSADGSIVDSVKVSLQIVGDHVTGRLDRLPGEKDRMLGTLDGTLKGDIINAFYTYQAEGSNATEQRALRLGPNYVALLDGEMEELPGGPELKDPAAAKEMERLAEVPCP